VSKSGGKGSAAAFCRDHHGNYVGASAVIFYGITDPQTLETLACREALALAEDISITRFLVTSDCSSVICDIKDGSL
jgi:ribonuclease HI